MAPLIPFVSFAECVPVKSVVIEIMQTTKILSSVLIVRELAASQRATDTSAAELTASATQLATTGQALT
jgi:hypothetical protein